MPINNNNSMGVNIGFKRNQIACRHYEPEADAGYLFHLLSEDLNLCPKCGDKLLKQMQEELEGQ